MSDIVERLLKGAITQPGNQHPTCDDVDAADALMAEAADEITRLRTALSEAEQRARREALEEAAKAAKTWLEDWGTDLQSTCDGYLDAIKSGRHNGRRIPPEMAKTFAGHFKERSDAVYDCGEHVAKAIRALIPSEPHDAEGRE